MSFGSKAIVKQEIYLHIVILRSGCDVVSVAGSVPGRQTHHSRLMATGELSDAREHSQVPESNFIAGGRVEIPRRPELKRSDWRFAGRY